MLEACDSRHSAAAEEVHNLRRTRRRLEDLAGVVGGFPFEPAGSESSNLVTVAAEVTKQPRATPRMRDPVTSQGVTELSWLLVMERS